MRVDIIHGENTDLTDGTYASARSNDWTEISLSEA